MYRCAARLCADYEVAPVLAESIPPTSAGGGLSSVLRLDAGNTAIALCRTCSLIDGACNCGFLGVTEAFIVVVELVHTVLSRQSKRGFMLRNLVSSSAAVEPVKLVPEGC